MRILLTLLLLCMVMPVGAGCGSGSGGDDGNTPPPGFPTPDLSPSLDPLQAEVAGEVDFDGFTLYVDPDPEAGHGGSAIGAATGIMAKIIDPGDDILSEKPILVNGGYRLGFRPAVSAKPIKVKVLFEMRVNEDLNGDGTGGDLLRQTVPMTVIQGKAALLNLSVRRADPRVVSPVFTPTAGETLYTSIAQTDTSGTRDSYFATLVASGEVVFDQDGDSVLAPGEDAVYNDTDQNGWPDESEAEYAAPGASISELEGVVASVDPPNRTISISVNGSVKTLQVDPFAVIQQLGLDGELLGQLTLEFALTGRTVRIESFGSDTALTATRILVLPQTTSGK
jgi:hypothetical protein